MPDPIVDLVLLGALWERKPFEAVEALRSIKSLPSSTASPSQSWSMVPFEHLDYGFTTAGSRVGSVAVQTICMRMGLECV